MQAIGMDLEAIPDPELTVADRALVLGLLEAKAARTNGSVVPGELTTYLSLCPSTARPVCAAFVRADGSTATLVWDMDLTGPVSEDTVAAAAIQTVPRPRQTTASAADPVIICRPTEGEADFLAACADEAGQGKPLVTFNGRGYDLLVLWHRSMRLGVKGPWQSLLAENRYRPERHVDLIDTLTQFGAGTRMPLAVYALGLLGWSPKTTMTGAGVLPAIEAGQPVDVLAYNYADTAATIAIWRLASAAARPTYATRSTTGRLF